MDTNRNSDVKDKIALLRGVRQVRQFRGEPVPQEVIDDILEVARWTGSGMNRQPWEFVVVRDREALKAIAPAEGEGVHLANATFAIIILMSGDDANIISFDEGRLTERMLLAAAAHGVGGGIWWFRGGGERCSQATAGHPPGPPYAYRYLLRLPGRGSAPGSTQAATGPQAPF